MELLGDDLGAVVIPLRAHLAQAGALVALFDPVHAPPGLDERELLASFADQAGLALDRAQAVVDREELAVISDRERIARDLHDVVIQRLFATGLQLQGVASLVGDPAIGDRLERAVDDLDLTIKAIRGTIFELQHRQSDSLRAEIRGLVREYVPVLGFTPVVLTSGPIDSAVPAAVREQLLPVLREAVSNVARHALADQAQVEVDVGDAGAAAHRRRRRDRSGRGAGGERAAQRTPTGRRARRLGRADAQRAARDDAGLARAAGRTLAGVRTHQRAGHPPGVTGPLGSLLLQDGVLRHDRLARPPAAEAPGVAGGDQGESDEGQATEDVVVDQRVVLGRQGDGPHHHVEHGRRRHRRSASRHRR